MKHLKIDTFVLAIIATVGVYGIVALMVRMDDAGYKLIKKGTDKSKLLVSFGTILVKSLPIIIRLLAVLGTLALLLVAGGIFAHHIDFFHLMLPSLHATLKEFIIGLGVGFVILLFVLAFQKIKKMVTS